MGFMDKFKDMADQAGDAAKQGMSPATAAESQRLNKIAQQGVEAPAVLESLTPVGDKQLGGGTEYELGVEVRPAGGDPYKATVRQQLIEQTVADFEGKVGQEITVKVDPDDPNSMVIWG